MQFHAGVVVPVVGHGLAGDVADGIDAQILIELHLHDPAGFSCCEVNFRLRVQDLANRIEGGTHFVVRCTEDSSGKGLDRRDGAARALRRSR